MRSNAPVLLSLSSLKSQPIESRQELVTVDENGNCICKVHTKMLSTQSLSVCIHVAIEAASLSASRTRTDICRRLISSSVSFMLSIELLLRDGH